GIGGWIWRLSYLALEEPGVWREEDGDEGILVIGRHIGNVFAVIVAQVIHGISYFGDGLQNVRMKSIGKDLAFSFHHSIERTGHANRPRLHSAGERFAIVCLDQKVNVFSLHGIHHEAKSETLFPAGKRIAQRSEATLASQIVDILANANGHMH